MKTTLPWICCLIPRASLSLPVARFVIAIAIVAMLPCIATAALKTENVFLITTDGLRWQEVFTGAEELLLNKTNGGVKDVETLRKNFWRDTPEQRRRMLLPFVWSEIGAKGQIYGNRPKGSDAHI